MHWVIDIATVSGAIFAFLAVVVPIYIYKKQLGTAKIEKINKCTKCFEVEYRQNKRILERFIEKVRISNEPNAIAVVDLLKQFKCTAWDESDIEGALQLLTQEEQNKHKRIHERMMLFLEPYRQTVVNYDKKLINCDAMFANLQCVDAIGLLRLLEEASGKSS